MSKLTLIAGGSTLVYAVLAVLMGVLPGMVLSRTKPGPGVVPLTPLQREGRDVFVANGCSYCHTQQVRPLAEDAVFGRPSSAGDYAYETPELLGSERNGPDLTNIGVRQPSEVWQYMHLYNPRSVVPQSIMPDFSFLFEVVAKAPAGVTPVAIPKPYAPEHGVVIPTRKAQALVAYLLSRKQATIPGYSPPATAPSGTAAAAAAATSSATAAGKATFDAAAGARLFAANCQSCHQASGEGIPGVFPPLKGDPVETAADPTEQISIILHGLEGKTIGGVAYPGQMPAFAAQLGDDEIADIIAHERTSWGNKAPLATAAQVAAERAKPAH
ncbi:MAG TPA: cbb3-type cytochrome c oxidase subunit II [Gemmatimonadaceae bacterium]|nr:cbb3-type cytochrome c oxidase subunit II [Gemmatimonadaceae bacterium]